MTEREQRTTKRKLSIETREDGKRVLTGYASVFYRSAESTETQYQLWDRCMERIAPTAFNRSIAESQDVIADFNHDENRILGRTSSGTLRLSVDATGLKYEIDLPSVTDPPNLAELIERGDIVGSSFAFRATGVLWTEEGDVEIRTITDCDLFDVGPVGRPAYTGTTASLRSDNRKAIEEELAARKKDSDSVAIRLRLLDL